MVQCAALVETNQGIVNLIMNEYDYYGNGHTNHSSGQIEWFKNSVDDRSVQVGGKQRICMMPMPCPWSAEVASCIFLYFVNPQMRI